jgi:hypothetical protein
LKADDLVPPQCRFVRVMVQRSLNQARDSFADMVGAKQSVFISILLQKSKLAMVRIFGETLKREAIDDSYNLSHVTEVAYEFSVRR